MVEYGGKVSQRDNRNRERPGQGELGARARELVTADFLAAYVCNTSYCLSNFSLKELRICLIRELSRIKSCTPGTSSLILLYTNENIVA